MPVINTTKALEFGSQVISSSVVAISATGASTFALENLALAQRARITSGAQPTLFRYDGGDPASGIGHYIAANETVIIDGNVNILNLKFLRAGSSDSTVSITLES